MDFRWDAPIFETLLKLNPWAVPFWAERAKLIAAHRWNVNAVSHGGNTETKAWMKGFLAARSEATLAMLLEATDVFEHWNLQTRALAIEVFDDPENNASHIGVPLLNQDETGGVASNAAIVPTYTNGQFLADFLLLAQAGLRGLVLHDPLDISDRIFSLGLDLQGAKFHAPFICRNVIFGPFSYFDMLEGDDVDFSGAEFYGTSAFTISEFYSKVDFSGAVFHGAFTATARFEGEANFSGAKFQSDVDFSGAWFAQRPDFSQAVFKGNTSFAHATFMDSACFDGASFPGKVWVGNIPADVRKKIEAANHP